MADSDGELDYEKVDVDDEGVKPVWSNRARSISASAENVSSIASRPRPQAIMASILKGDISSSIQGLKSLRSPPEGPAPKPPTAPKPRPPKSAAGLPPSLPPPNNTKRVRPPPPPPPSNSTMRRYTMNSLPPSPPKPKMKASLSAADTKNSSLATVEETLTKLSRDVMSNKADLLRTDGRAMKAMEDVSKARTEIGEIRAMMEQLKQTCSSLHNKMDNMRHVTPSYSLPPTPTTEVSPRYDSLQFLTPVASPGGTAESAYYTTDEATREDNRRFLATLDFVQILNLLDSMGLKKHYEAFMEERVNGEILLECDDAVLQDELKVTSKIQRSRMMKLIQGQYSAKKILQGEDPYVFAQPK